MYLPPGHSSKYLCMKTLFIALLLGTILLVQAQGPELELKPTKDSPMDLGLEGLLEGFSEGKKAYIAYETLLSFPEVTTITDRVAGLPGEHELTILPFRALWNRLPLAPEADAVIVDCDDGWKTTYTHALLDRFEPHFVLKVGGKEPASFPFDQKLVEHLHPYLIDVSYKRYPEYHTGSRGWESLNPAGSETLRIINYDTYYAAYFSGPFADIAEETAADRGRDYFMLNCMACHRGPEDVGGVKSDRPFMILQAMATHSPDYFRQYLKDPTAIRPDSQMVPFSHMLDGQMADLIEFLKVGMP